ncbi:MAG: hypothetical protein GY757_05285 [bacterium]|nr:hypothetical protein [bacterium]
MTKWKTIFVAILILSFFFVALPVNGDSVKSVKVKDFKWLKGQWISPAADSTIYESWESGDCGILKGKSSATDSSGKATFSKILRIEKIGSHIVYIATVKGSNPTLFTLVEIKKVEGAKAWVFENKEHDFPRRIIYIKKSRLHLQVNVEGTKNGKKVSEEVFFSKLEK